MRRLISLVALCLALPIATAQTATGKVSVLWLGQSAFKITTPQGQVVVTTMPMHYGANPLARGTATEFVEAMGNSAIRVIVPAPGQEVSF